MPAITSHLTITGSHAVQATGGGATTTIDGTLAAHSDPGAGLFRIAARASLTLEALQVQNVSGAAVSDGGALVTWGVTFARNHGTPIVVLASSATAHLNESTIDGAIGSAGLSVRGGSVLLSNSDVVNNALGGIATRSGRVTADGTLIAHNGGPDCSGARITSNDSMDDDGTCHVRFSHETYWSTHRNFPALTTNGGPVATDAMPAGSPTAGADRDCPTTDARFFANAQSGDGRIGCDIGAVSSSALRQTGGPSCHVARLSALVRRRRSQVAFEQVSVSDPLSGLGPRRVRRLIPTHGCDQSGRRHHQLGDRERQRHVQGSECPIDTAIRRDSAEADRRRDDVLELHSNQLGRNQHALLVIHSC